MPVTVVRVLIAVDVAHLRTCGYQGLDDNIAANYLTDTIVRAKPEFLQLMTAIPESGSDLAKQQAILDAKEQRYFKAMTFGRRLAHFIKSNPPDQFTYESRKTWRRRVREWVNHVSCEAEYILGAYEHARKEGVSDSDPTRQAPDGPSS